MNTNGDAAKNARRARASDNASRRHWCQATTTSGTATRTPGYLAAAANPIATPASSKRPVTSSASATVTNVVNGTSVTAACEKATCVDSTAVTSAAIAAATVPYAAAPSHQAAATPATASATTTSRPVRYEGSPCHA